MDFRFIRRGGRGGGGTLKAHQEPKGYVSGAIEDDKTTQVYVVVVGGPPMLTLYDIIIHCGNDRTKLSCRDISECRPRIITRNGWN